MATKEDISEQFEEMGIEPSDEVLEKCVDLCLTYDINDATEFVEQWMAFSLSHLNGKEPSLKFLLDMERKELINNKKKDSVLGGASNTNQRGIGRRNSIDLNHFEDSSTLKIYGATTIGSYPSDLSNVDDTMIMDSYGCITPKSNKFSAAITPGSSRLGLNTASYSPLSANGTPRSQHSGKIVFTYGSSNLLKQATWFSKQEQNLTIKSILCHENEFMSEKTKYMYDQLLEKCWYLEEQLYQNGRALCEKVFGNDSLTYDLRGVNETAHDPVKIIGRICCDFEGKLDGNSVQLIGADEMKLTTVRLNFGRSKPFGVFPGQIVMISGTNPRGDIFYVDEIMGERILNTTELPKVDKPLNVVIAAGPFTNYDDLVYDPLLDLLMYCKDNRPDLLILTGPFLDEDHSMVAGNLVIDSYETVWEKMVFDMVSRLDTTIQILMISSHKDVISNMVYPTHPNHLKKSYKNVHLLSDPCIVDVNGMTVGITSSDIYNHLIEEELSVNAGDKAKRIVNYILHQGSFYPLNPVHHDMCLDFQLTNKFAKLEKVPNILVLPSVQKNFIRDVNGCLAINPGKLTDKNGGTFCRLTVHPNVVLNENDSETKLTDVFTAQIRKI